MEWTLRLSPPSFGLGRKHLPQPGESFLYQGSDPCQGKELDGSSLKKAAPAR